MYGLINVELLMKFLCLATLENKNSTFAPDICPERNPQVSYPREAYTPEECLAPGSYKNDLKKFTNMVVDIDFLLNIIHNQSNCEICSTVECNREAEEILSYLNEKVSPCDDFYEFACGGWINQHKEKPVSVYSELENHIQVSLKNMLEENITRKNPDFVRKIKGIYRSCMDADRLSIGSEQLKEAVRDLEKWPIRFGKLWDSESFNWMDTLIQLRRKGFSHNTFISLSVVKDPNNNMTNIIELDQPSLSHPDSLRCIERNCQKREDYRDFILKTTYLLRPNDSSLPKFTFSTLNPYFESVILQQNFEYDLSRLFSPVKEKKRYTIQQLMEEAPEIDWLKYFNGVLSDKIYGNESLIINDIDYIKNFARFIETEDKREVSNYMFWRVIEESLPLLSKEWRTVEDHLPKQLDRHQPEVHEDQPRWKQCLDFVMDNFDIAFNTYYQRRYFESHFVHDIKYMFDYIQYIVRRDLMKNTWKDLASEKMAKEKASSMEIRVSYPKNLIFDPHFSSLYSDLKLGEENFFEKVLKVRKWSADNSLSLRLNPSQRHALELRRLFEEYANGSSAKIIYNYGKNRIEVPTGILQKAFFKGNRPQSLNWGAIGSLIAQKVTNAFYYEGQYYDSRGNGVEWWRPEVTEDFKNKESCFREQYLEYLQNDYGTNLEEDLTDLPPQYVTATAGLKAAYLAYNFSMTSQENEFLPGLVYTPNQLFWISAAQVMCENPSKENVEERLLNGTYVPAKFKVIGAVSNLPQFAQDFNCPSGAPMNPERKCKLW